MKLDYTAPSSEVFPMFAEEVFCGSPGSGAVTEDWIYEPLEFDD